MLTWKAMLDWYCFNGLLLEFMEQLAAIGLKENFLVMLYSRPLGAVDLIIHSFHTGWRCLLTFEWCICSYCMVRKKSKVCTLHFVSFTCIWQLTLVHLLKKNCKFLENIVDFDTWSHLCWTLPAESG